MYMTLENLLSILDTSYAIYVYKNDVDIISNVMFCSYQEEYCDLVARYAEWDVLYIKVLDEAKAIQIAVKP